MNLFNKIFFNILLFNINKNFSCCCKNNENKNNQLNLTDDNNDNENNKKDREDPEKKEKKDKKEDIDELKKLLPDKLNFKKSFYRWDDDYCGIQCCCYFLATLFYNEDEILKEFADSNIKFLNNIATIVNDFKKNNVNNECHKLLFNSICDLFFEISESLTQDDLNLLQKNEDEVDKKLKKRYEIANYFYVIGIDLIKFISLYKINYEGKNKLFCEIMDSLDLNIIKKYIPELKIYYNSKSIDHTISSTINFEILNLLSYFNENINFKNDGKILINNNNKFEFTEELKNNINLIYSFYTVNLGERGHGCCFYYNFKDGNYYFVSNEKEIEVPLEYIINTKVSEETKINLLYKKINEQNIISLKYKFHCEYYYLYKL